MATVTIRLDDQIRDELEELARTNGVTLSVLMRDQIDALLGRGVKMRRTDIPHALSMQQRLILAQQHQILAKLHADDEDESSYHENLVKVLHEGYAGEYEAVFAAIRPELTRAECGLLWDILDMFRILGASLTELSDTDKQALGVDQADRLRFAGFDLNDALEGRLLGYVRYLVQTDRWEEIVDRLKEVGDNGNSHSSRLPSYQRMLAVYKPIITDRTADRGFSREAWLLGVEELRTVAKAWARSELEW